MSDPEDRTPDDDELDDEELAELADELSGVLRELRDELQATREARGEQPVEQPPIPEGGAAGDDDGLPDIPFDLPSATDVLAFTDEKLIPAAITVLEVNIRALELLQKGIRWARPDKAGENARRVRSHAESVSRSSLQRLDTVLADLQDAASEGALPENAEASGVITEARELRDEIDAALRERAESRDETGDTAGDEEGEEGTDDEGRTSPWDDQPEVDVDVESELESIKAELGKDEDDEEADGPDDEAAPGEGEDEPTDADGEETDADGTDGDHGGSEGENAPGNEDTPAEEAADADDAHPKDDAAAVDDDDAAAVDDDAADDESGDADEPDDDEGDTPPRGA